MSFVTSPSYFLGQNGVQSVIGLTAGLKSTSQNAFLAGQNAGAGAVINNLVLIGVNAFSAGLNDTNGAGTVSLGTNDGTAISTFTGTVGGLSSSGPDIFIGPSVFSAAVSMPGTVAIGSSIASTLVAATNDNVGGNVIIGVLACSNVASIQTAFGMNVIIGYQAYQTVSTGGMDASNNVIIGAMAMAGGGSQGTGQLAGNVAVGFKAGYSLLNASNDNTFVGTTAGANMNSGCNYNTMIGYAANAQGASMVHNTCVGYESTPGSGPGSNYNTVIGANGAFSSASSTVNVGNIIIGSGAGSTGFSTAVTSNFLVEENHGTKYTMMYGVMTSGNLCVGNSTAGTNRDFGGGASTNVLKLITGTAGGTAPLGGGYFYYSGTALIFIGISGTPVTLATT